MNNCTKVASQRWARPPEGAPPPDWISASRIKIGGWVVALALGMAQAWATRFTMNPDGVSYLDIGDAYWRHDWHNAINAYWSPLYSWILGFFINVIGPTPYWEYPLVHLVNFFIYVFALACFEYFLSTFIAHSKGAALSRQNGFDESSWRLLGYGLFISSSLILVGTGLVTPDMLVVGVFYLASALLLQVGAPHAPLTTYAELGIVLGIGYLTKTVMFPLAFIFLIVAGFSSRLHIDRLRRTGLSVLLFVAVCTPLITAISFQKHHLTFGETGSWNYAFYVDGVPYWVGNSPGLTHPMRPRFMSLGLRSPGLSLLGMTRRTGTKESSLISRFEVNSPHFSLLRQSASSSFLLFFSM
jgi:hypothetical protein